MRRNLIAKMYKKNLLQSSEKEIAFYERGIFFYVI